MRSAALRSHVVSEISRVLKPGGFVFWWDHYAIAPTNADTALRPADYFDWPIREFGVGELSLRFRLTPHLELEGAFGGGRQQLKDGKDGTLEFAELGKLSSSGAID